MELMAFVVLFDRFWLSLDGGSGSLGGWEKGSA